jgi:hypothetical protein
MRRDRGAAVHLLKVTAVVPQRLRDAFYQVAGPTDAELPLAGAKRAPPTVSNRPRKQLMVYLCTRLCHGCAFVFFAYLMLALLSLYATPFPACVTIFDSCDCSCQVVDGDNPDNPSVYHPAAPGRLSLGGALMDRHATAYRTLRPGGDGDASLCGACPITADGVPYERCRVLAEAQTLQLPLLNGTQDLSCYRQACATAITEFLQTDVSAYRLATTLQDRLCAIKSKVIHSVTDDPCNINVLSMTPGHRWSLCPV